MKPILSIESISDGIIYDFNDLVNADAGGCQGCSACCEGIGEFVKLNPLDIHEMRLALGLDFDPLVAKYLDLRIENKIQLPHLGMVGDDQRCSLLDQSGRCSIHLHRPDICRLFPLGRFYDQDDFKYFLQVDACVKPNLAPIVVEKWLNVDRPQENKRFILAWNRVVKALEFRVKFIRDQGDLDELNTTILDAIYRIPLQEDFYGYFFKELPGIKSKLGIL